MKTIVDALWQAAGVSALCAAASLMPAVQASAQGSTPSRDGAQAQAAQVQATRVQAERSAAAPEVLTLRLSLSNLHVIRGARVILVDAGSKADMPRLESELQRAGIAWKDIAALIVTHAHSDHTGLAAEIRRRSGAAVVLGRGDIPMAQAGRHDELQPTNFTAAVIKQFFIDPTFEPFQPDVTVEAEHRLDRWGVAGRVYSMPGHTPGSLVIELDDGRTFVGDMILGGVLGGALMAQRAGEHYFHADRQRNLQNIHTLLRGSTRVFYLGHGGPVTRESVIEAFGTGTPTVR